jgi:hypothetical protein
VIDAPAFTEWHHGICAIDAARAGVGQMFYIRMSAGLKDIGEGNDIAFNIGGRIFQAITDACLSCEMNDPVEWAIRKASFHTGRIGQIDSVEAVIACALRRALLKKREPGLLDIRRIVVVYDIGSDDRVAAPQQMGSDVKSDESGIACYQNAHFVISLL